MAVTSFVETWEGRGGTEQLKKTRSGFPLRARSYERVFYATTNSALDEAATVKAYTSCPKLGAVYVGQGAVFDTQARCVDVQAKQRPESPYEWVVTCRYSTDYLDGDADENPLLRPPRIRYSSERYTEPLTIDVVTGFYVKNAALDPFVPPPKVDRSMPIITITRNEATYPFTTQVLYSDTVNSDTWLGLSARKAKILEISGEDKPPENGYSYAEVTYKIAIRYATWDIVLVNAGFRYYASSKYHTILTEDGKPIREPVPLTADGTNKLPYGDAINTLTFKGYRELPFADLNLP